MPQAGFNPPRFFSWAFFLMGLGGTVVFGYMMIWPPIRANLFFAETTCTILDKRLAEQNGEDGMTYRPEVHIQYTVNGVPHRAWTYDAAGVFSNERDAHQRTLNEFQVGRPYPCWFDPAEPGRAVLTRRFTWWGLMVLIPVAFMVFGAVGLMGKLPPPEGSKPTDVLNPEMRRLGGRFVALFFGGFLVAAAVSAALMFTFAGVGQPFWLLALMFFGPFLAYIGVLGFVIVKVAARIRRAMPSPERAAVQMMAALPADDTTVEGSAAEWPTVPPLAVDPTAGSTLRYRLTSSTGPWLSLLVIFGIALFWNGIVSIFVVHAIDGHRVGNPEWFLTVFLIPFVLIGLVLIAAVVGAVLQAGTSALSGRLSVEVSEYAMRPGGRYEFLVEQSGPFRLGQVRLVLACTESATYTQGTDTRTETKEVVNEGVGRAEAMPSDGLRGTVAVPADAMHSFESGHNKITWTLRVKGWVAGILPYRSEFPVLVLPASEGGMA